MSARKPIVLGVVICGLIASTARADGISWPSGLDNWVIYLAAPSGNAETGPINYTAPQAIAAAPAAWPDSSNTTPPATAQPAPAPPAPVSPPASLPPVPATPPVTSSPPSANTTPVVTPPPPVITGPPAPSLPPVTYSPSVSVSPQSTIAVAPAPVPAPAPPVAAQTSMVQPLTYIHPASSQATSVQPVVYTPPATVASAPVINSQPSTAVSSLSAVTPTSTPPASSPVQAFINVGNGAYPLASAITTGGAQPWYNSSQLTTLFGGHPTAQQIQSFDSAILQRVQQTFSQSGVNVSLTENPNVSSLHTISLVSNTASSTLPNAIGMTQVGSNGFSFIDQIAPSAHSLDQLEWIVAHNISHELMLAFGVPENYDTTGNYVDSKMASWAMMVNPGSTFSSAASQALIQSLASQTQAVSGTTQLGAQEVNPPPIPEPTTVAMWGLAAVAVAIAHRRHTRRTRSPLPAA